MLNKSVTFCDSQFWDQEVTWLTDIPSLTQCFSQTVLPVIPLIVLIGLLSYDLYVVRSFGSSLPPIPYQFKIRLYLVIIINLIIIETINISKSLWNHFTNEINLLIISELFSPLIKLITYLKVITLVIYFREFGYRHPVSIPIVWLCALISESISLYSTLITTQFSNDIFEHTLQIIEVSLTLIALFISCLTLNISEYQSINTDYQPKCPKTDYNVFSRIFYIWITRLLRNGYKTTTDFTQYLLPICYYQKSVNSYKSFKKSDNKYNKNRTLTSRRLFPLIWSIIWRPWMFGFFLVLCETGADFVQPYNLSNLIDFVSGADHFLWHGIFYAIVYCMVNVLARLLSCHYFTYFKLVGYRVRTALTTAVYKKMLRLSSGSRREYTTGDINNLMGVDIIQMSTFFERSVSLITIPFKICIGLYLLWQYLGPSSLTLFAVVLTFGSLTTFVMKRVGSIQSKQMSLKDKRMEQLSEILNNIKLLKLFGWEKPFIARVTQTRAQELNKLMTFHYFFSVIQMLFIVVPALTVGLTFTVFTLVSDQPLTPKTAFVSLSILNLLRHPFVEFPNLLSQMVTAFVSYKRIRKYLSSEELSQNMNENNCDNNETAVHMTDCSFAWSIDDEPVLKQINLDIRKGSLVAIVGRVGSGKSSIFSALLGDMYRRVGADYQLSGSIAYVPQTAWIQNTTLRENITFMKDYGFEKFERVVDGCALKPDFDLLPARDFTEIGEKGINLSGGQKQRVSLARAVYQESDIYLLDDPLSAVDAHVAQHLFHEVIGPTGLLYGKTRILVTHNLTFLDKVDQIIVMSSGRIVAQGSYDELFKKGLLSKQVLDDPDNRSNSSDDSLQQQSHRIDKKESTERLTLKEKMRIESKRDQLIEEEQQRRGNIGFAVYWHYFRNFGIFFAVIPFLTAIVYNSCEVGASYYLNIWTSQNSTLLNEQANKNEFLTIYLSLIGVNALFIAITEIVFRLGSIKAAAKLHQDMLLSIMRAPLLFFTVTPLGRIINRFSSDFTGIDNQIPMAVISCFTTFIWFSIILGTIFYNNPIMLALTLVVVIIFIFQYKYYLWTSRQLNRLDSITRSPVFNHFNESIAGAVSIRAYKVEQTFIERLQKLVDTTININKHIVLTLCWMNFWSTLIGTIITLSIAIVVVLKADQTTPGFAGFVLIYSMEMINSFSFALRSTARLENSMISVERVREYSELESEADWESVPECKPPNGWPSKGKIKFIDYTTSYRPELEPVLKDLNFNVKRCEKIGIVGRTGAGKSSITFALFRILEPSFGRILIDGVDISRIGLHDLRSKITIIPQEPNLFAGTLKLNLDPFSEYSDIKLWSALKSAHLEEFFCNTSEGLSYDISEGGDNLSGGQRQLVCLARALLRETKILVLDEATAACDIETDRLIQTTITEQFNDCTVITIAHRLNTVLDYNYNKIIVLENGVIVEMDSPNNLLMNRNSLFYSLAKESGIILKDRGPRRDSCCMPS